MPPIGRFDEIDLTDLDEAGVLRGRRNIHHINILAAWFEAACAPAGCAYLQGVVIDRGLTVQPNADLAVPIVQVRVARSRPTAIRSRIVRP